MRRALNGRSWLTPAAERGAPCFDRFGELGRHATAVERRPRFRALALAANLAVPRPQPAALLLPGEAARLVIGDHILRMEALDEVSSPAKVTSSPSRIAAPQRIHGSGLIPRPS
jgi:hypothetical protein